MNDAVLEAVLLKKRYNKTIALNDFNLKLQKGTILGLLGPNGAGKSTFINISANIIKEDSGELIIFNEKIHVNSYKYKYKCGFLFEKPVYIGKFTAAEYLNFAGILYGLQKKTIVKRINELCLYFNFKDKQNEWIERISKGTQKKVSISAALIHNPKLLIFDEPFADLDLIAIERIKDLFNTLRNKGVSVLLASNNIKELETICDNIAILNEGTIIYKDKTSNIQQNRDLTIENKYNSKLENLYFDLLSCNKDVKKLSWLV